MADWRDDLNEDEARALTAKYLRASFSDTYCLCELREEHRYFAVEAFDERSGRRVLLIIDKQMGQVISFRCYPGYREAHMRAVLVRIGAQGTCRSHSRREKKGRTIH